MCFLNLFSSSSEAWCLAFSSFSFKWQNALQREAIIFQSFLLAYKHCTLKWKKLKTVSMRSLYSIFGVSSSIILLKELLILGMGMAKKIIKKSFRKAVFKTTCKARKVYECFHSKMCFCFFNLKANNASSALQASCSLAASLWMTKSRWESSLKQFCVKF